MTSFTVTNLNDSGAGSLRAAIQSADAATGTSSTIVFAVRGNILLASDLPDISQSVTINATTAPGATAGGAPVVGIDFNGYGGLTFAAGSDQSSLLGVAVGGATGNGITIASSGVTIAGNYVGLTMSGTALANGAAGIYVASTSSGNAIGSNPAAAPGVVSNVISGNAGNGIVLDGSSGNTLVDNYIGTNPTGTGAIANGGNGILVTGGAANNLIGGTAYTNTMTGAVNNPTGTEGSVTPVIVTPPLGNLVSGNGGDGILINDGSAGNVLNGNFVGTTASGDAALGNAGDGVAIVDADNNSLIGCTAIEDPFVYYNVISGNGSNGLHITNSDNTTVQANFFGIGANNATVVGNKLNGILVDGSSSNTTVGGVIPLGNVSAGNGLNGIDVADTASHFISFNTFGGLFAFGAAAPNGNDGVLITSTSGSNTLQTNVFSGNVNNGIEIGGNASGVTVDPNIVGLATDGTALLSGGSNGNDGLEINGTAHDNIIGGDEQSVIPENTFSGNAAYGVAISDSAYDNQVFSSNIGVDVVGNQAFGNGEGGVLVSGTATENTVGGAAASGVRVANIISGNEGNGVTLGDSSSVTTVTNDIIGYGAQGDLPIPNEGAPVASGNSTGNTIADNQTLASSASGATVNGGAGNVTLSGGASPFYFVGGSGAATISGGSGNTTMFGSTGNANSVLTGGSGSNILVAGYGASTLIGGSGTAQEFTTGSGPALLIGATGTTTINGTTGTGPEQAFTGHTQSLIALNAAADSVIGGSGVSTVVGGTSPDVYGFINGYAGGDEVIEGLKADDTLAFGGYGAVAITSEGVLNGSDLITLSDGTTILLLGLNHEVFNGLT